MNTYRIVLDSTLDAEELRKMVEGMTKPAGTELTVREFVSTTKPLTKGQQILGTLRSEAERPVEEAVLTRAEIAAAVGCVVGRVAEIIKEFGEDPLVKKYLTRLEADKLEAIGARAAAKEAAKAEAKKKADEAKAAKTPLQKAFAKAAADLSGVVGEMLEEVDSDSDVEATETGIKLIGKAAYEEAVAIINEGKALPSDELLTEANAYAKKAKRRQLLIESVVA